MTTEQARLWVFVLLSMAGLYIASQTGAALVAVMFFGGLVGSAAMLLFTERGEK